MALERTLLKLRQVEAATGWKSRKYIRRLKKAISLYQFGLDQGQ